MEERTRRINSVKSEQRSLQREERNGGIRKESTHQVAEGRHRADGLRTGVVPQSDGPPETGGILWERVQAVGAVWLHVFTSAASVLWIKLFQRSNTHHLLSGLRIKGRLWETLLPNQLLFGGRVSELIRSSSTFKLSLIAAVSGHCFQTIWAVIERFVGNEAAGVLGEEIKSVLEKRTIRLVPSLEVNKGCCSRYFIGPYLGLASVEQITRNVQVQNVDPQGSCWTQSAREIGLHQSMSQTLTFTS